MKFGHSNYLGLVWLIIESFTLMSRKTDVYSLFCKKPALVSSTDITSNYKKDYLAARAFACNHKTRNNFFNSC
jgi:hypothetical protein